MSMRVVMTGAAGGVGAMIRPFVRKLASELVLSDLQEITDCVDNEVSHAADLTDQDAIERLLEGADGLIHLGGQSVEADWEAVLDANIIGLYNTYEAARRQGCKRIIFATTNHVVGYYRRQRTIDHTVMPRPDSRYGASKAFGEALGRLYADKHGLRVLNIRIGNVGEKPLDVRRLAIWISPRDLSQLIGIGLTHPDLHYEVVYGGSDNARSWWDNSNAYRLGYQPQDQAEAFAEIAHEASNAKPDDPITAQFQGGTFCADEFDGETGRIT
ncbi:MAG: NAD(P)-dependent oxidoreductase [Alphaproteobacteria bacterium]|nr:NAD(P)-dependent oxidoreductase [Alphaproteobacteria bacterium]